MRKLLIIIHLFIYSFDTPLLLNAHISCCLAQSVTVNIGTNIHYIQFTTIDTNTQEVLPMFSVAPSDMWINKYVN